MQSANLVVVGKVSGAFGIKGWLKISSFTRPPDKIIEYAPWRLKNPGRSFEVEIVEARLQGKGLVVRLAGIDDRDEAQQLRGMEIVVSRDKLPEPEVGHYYWTDIEGLLVRTTAGEELGTVEQMLSAGAADVMVIEGKRRLLVPFILQDTVVEVDLEAGWIEVDWSSDG